MGGSTTKLKPNYRLLQGSGKCKEEKKYMKNRQILAKTLFLKKVAKDRKINFKKDDEKPQTTGEMKNFCTYDSLSQ